VPNYVVVDRDKSRRESGDFCWDSKFLPSQHILLSYHEAFSCQQVFADTAYFWLNQPVLLTHQIFADAAYFCWVITRNFADSSDFADTSYFCWISWFLLRQQIFAYSVYFTESSPTETGTKTKTEIRTKTMDWYSIFLRSHHHVFVLTNQILLTHHILLNQLILLRQQIFAYSAIFCWASSGILITQRVFADTAYFYSLDQRLNVNSRIQYCVKSMM